MHIKKATNGEADGPSVALVIPCYNEEKRLIADTFLSFVRQFPNVCFLFVDDGSTDNTRQIIHILCDKQPQNIALLSLQKNMGKAEAVRHGLLRAVQNHPDYTGYWDADLSTPLPEVFGMLRTAQAHPKAEMITGARVRLMGRTIERRTMLRYPRQYSSTHGGL
jgi:glycosyltransferase involved in cell wall biosynthesis